MRELLERWAEMEPERCRFGVGYNDLVYVGEKGGVPGETVTLLQLPLSRQEAALLLAAAIKAIEERGWSFKARHLVGHSEASVEVRSAQSLLVWPYKATADTFTEALLGAYLAALEAEEGAQ